MPDNKKIREFDLFIDYYLGVIGFAIFMLAVALWIHKNKYLFGGDELMGIVSACAFFFGILLLGQGIRGWRDGEEMRAKFIKVRSRFGANLMIRSRKRKKQILSKDAEKKVQSRLKKGK